MFGRDNIYGMVGGFTVRVKDEREQDKNHLVEATFEVPLTFEIMDEINPAMAKDLYNVIKGEHIPKPELNDVGLNLAPPQQIMIIRNHPDLDPDTKVAGVNLRKIRTKKAEGNAWLLVFTATWTLGDPKEAIVMIQRLKQGVHLTFTEQAPKLDLDGDTDVIDGEVQEATVDGGGNVTSLTAKRRGRKRRNPDVAAADQADEAAARRALPDSDVESESDTDHR